MQMLLRRQLLLASLAVTLCVVGCTRDEERLAAQRVLDHHFDALRRRTYDAALVDYDKHFFTEVSRPEWSHALATVVDKLGSYRSYDISTFGMAFKKVAGPGKYFRVECTVTYSKHTSEEIFYLVRKQGKSTMKIVGHQIDAEGLSK